MFELLGITFLIHTALKTSITAQLDLREVNRLKLPLLIYKN